jgi:type IV pilus assembly protein PilN
MNPVRINLLPHREERRKRQRVDFAILSGAFVLAGLAVWGAGHLVLAGYVDHQQARNEYLRRENAKLDKEIETVRRLKDDIQALLARKQVIESLQTDRSQSVQLLDQLARQTPEGIYLRSIRQDHLKVSVEGYAQSNARVSTLMRNLQSAGIFEDPVLVEVKAATVGKKRLSEFGLTFVIKPALPASPALDRAAAAGAAAGAAKVTKG